MNTIMNYFFLYLKKYVYSCKHYDNFTNHYADYRDHIIWENVFAGYVHHNSVE